MNPVFFAGAREKTGVREKNRLSSYRYGFNGKEADDENAGDLDFGARIYDARLGRFLSVDPDAKKYAFMSTYCFAGNQPTKLIDVNGEGPGDPTYSLYYFTGTRLTYEALIPRMNGYVDVPNGSWGLYAHVKAREANRYTDVLVAFQTPSGQTIEWSNTANWYVDSQTKLEYDGEGYSTWWLNRTMPFAENLYGAAFYEDFWDGFAADWNLSGGSISTFLGMQMAKSVHSIYSDISYGGHRRSLALSSMYLGLSSGGPMAWEGMFSSVKFVAGYGVKFGKFVMGNNPIGGAFGRSMFTSSGFGYKSLYFGNGAMGNMGEFNIPKTSPRIGWSGTGSYNGSYVFRIGYELGGPRHFDIFKVSNAVGNSLIKKP